MALVQGTENSGSSQQEVVWASFLPAGNGQLQTGVYCTMCHDLKIVVGDRRTDRDGWTRIVETMAYTHEAPIPDEDIPVISEYLAQHFNSSTPVLELPVNINTAPKEILTLLSAFTAEDVQKLLEARKRRKITDWSMLEAIVGKDKAENIKGFVSFREEAGKAS